MFNRIIILLARILFSLRYRIKIKGVKDISLDDRTILFMPNHPALIDPLILATYLYKKFRVRPLVAEDQLENPVNRFLTRRARAITVPDLMLTGRDGKANVEKAMKEVVKSLKNRGNVLFYPAGRLYRTKREMIGGKSGVEQILKEIPDQRVVLIRTSGLWGSSFSRAGGYSPAPFKRLGLYILSILSNLIFFGPRRKVTIEVVEPEDFPRGADRLEINKYLENFYNRVEEKNIRVPYSWFQGFKSKVVDESQLSSRVKDTSFVADKIKFAVIDRLKDESGISNISENSSLSSDLGLDSLTLSDFALWIETEFAVEIDDLEGLETVADCMLAAQGESIGQGKADLKPVDKKWFKESSKERLDLPEVTTIAENFLNQAKKNKNRAVLADELSGVKTYGDILLGIMALKPFFDKLEGDRVGIMLPATISATISYISLMFTGKTPVMVNWTVGKASFDYSLNNVGVKTVITARALVEKIKKQGVDYSDTAVNFIYLEDIGKKLSTGKKIKALIKSKLFWKSLYKVKVSDTAVILFTSGSEAKAKAVPLTHKNILSNIAAFNRLIPLYKSDKLLGMLPPFHSFGLNCTTVFPLCSAIQVVYHANPTEGAVLAKVVDTYGVTMMVGTPTFINGIVRSVDHNLESPRIIVTGAEKCPDHVYKACKKVSPGATILEGYGITECSPVVSANKMDDAKEGSIGHVLDNIEYVIIDSARDEEVKRGERGLLLVRGDSIFSGYLGKYSSTPFREFNGKEWYNTGDLVTEDEKGRLFFSGRVKRFVKIGGEMISLPAVEEALGKYFPSSEDGPSFAIESTVDDRPDLVLFSTFDIEKEKVNSYIKESGLSALHNIKQIIKIGEIPVLGTGKTNYRELKEKYLSAAE